VYICRHGVSSMQCAWAILLSVAWLALLYFSTSHKWHDFLKKLLNIKCVLIFSTIFICNILHSKKNWVRYAKQCILVFTQSTYYTCPNETWIFLTDFWKILIYQIWWKSIQWEPSCSTQTDGWMDRHDKASSHLNNSAKAPKNDTRIQEM
jgi:hypothetical protein